MPLTWMNVSHYVGLKFEQINEQFRKYDSNPMKRTLGADAGAGTKPAELRPEIPPNVDCRTEVMEGDSGMHHDGLSYPPFSRNSRNGIHSPHRYSKKFPSVKLDGRCKKMMNAEVQRCYN